MKNQPPADLPLSRIQVGKTNPRKRFDPKALADLTESVRTHGVLQPILVRFINGSDRFELIAGERRFRAATAAGLDTIPAIARELTDQQALELQVIENLQREGLHPLEEAEGYERLMQTHGYTAESLAERIGKSKAYVYARMKLLALIPKARELLWEDKITHSVALLLARIPDPGVQAEALKEIGPDQHHDAMSYREAVETIHRRFMLQLKAAPFNVKKEYAIPVEGEYRPACAMKTIGPCAACPKRTGNQKELFPDVASADVCTDPVCFGQKKAAHQRQQIARAQADGHTVMPKEEAAKVLRYGRLDWSEKRYADLAATCDLLPYGESTHGKKWKALLGKHCPPVIVAVDDRGDLHELVEKPAAIAALKAAGVKLEAAEVKAAQPVDRAKVIFENKVQRETTKRLGEAVLIKARAMEPDHFYPLILMTFLERFRVKDLLQKELKIETDADIRPDDDELAAALAVMEPAARAEVLLRAWLGGEDSGKWSQHEVDELAVTFGVEVKKIGESARKALLQAQADKLTKQVKPAKDSPRSHGGTKETKAKASGKADLPGGHGEIEEAAKELKPDSVLEFKQGACKATIQLANAKGLWALGYQVKLQDAGLSSPLTDNAHQLWPGKVAAIQQGVQRIMAFLATNQATAKLKLAFIAWAKEQGAAAE